jgi:hypothetical protein
MDDNAAVSVDGRQYLLKDLSESAKSQLMNLRVADQKIAQAQQDLAILQTARNAYARALSASLPKVSQ